jgi:hypothetical protein
MTLTDAEKGANYLLLVAYLVKRLSLLRYRHTYIAGDIAGDIYSKYPNNTYEENIPLVSYYINKENRDAERANHSAEWLENVAKYKVDYLAIKLRDAAFRAGFYLQTAAWRPNTILIILNIRKL